MTYVAQEQLRASAELATFLQSQQLGGAAWSRRVEEGAPLRIISEAAAEIQCRSSGYRYARPLGYRQGSSGKRG